MMRDIVIADIHNRWEKIERLLQRLDGLYDRAIFLGDSFDSKDDSPGEAEATARWLSMSIQQPKRIHLLGNHCLPYIFPNQANRDHYCPGWTQEKHDRIRPHFKRLPCERIFKLAFASGTWLFSHAGISYDKRAFPAALQYGEISAEHIAQLLNGYMPALARGAAPDWITRPGERMLTGQGPGGVLWADWGDLVPIPGVNQCVGHTGRFGARFKQTGDSMAICLDSWPRNIMALRTEESPARSTFGIFPVDVLLRNPKGGVEEIAEVLAPPEPKNEKLEAYSSSLLRET
jgi:hypothetical protein